MAKTVELPDPLSILALTALVGVGGVALYFIIPVLANAIALIIASFTVGVPTTGALAEWALPVTTISVAVIGFSGAAVVVHNVSVSLRKTPYQWGLPLLGVFAGFASALAKGVLSDEISRWLFGGVTALLVVVAGACYERPGRSWKVVAVILYLLPPAIIVGLSMNAINESTLAAKFSEVSGGTWLAVGLMVVIGILIGIVARLDESKNSSGG